MKKTVASNHNPVYCNICNKWGVFLAITYPDIVIGNFRKTVHLGSVRIV